MTKTTFNSKYLKIFFLIFFLHFFNSISYSQCAGNDNSITICAKETYNQGIGNPNGILNLYTLLGGVPTPGGTWTDLNSSGGLNPITGLLNTWLINKGGVYTYRYTVTGVPGCIDNISIITLTLGGFPGVSNPSAVACEDQTSVPLFSFLGSNPNPTINGSWSGGPPGTVTGNFFNATLAGVGTYNLTYTVPAVGTCPARSALVTLEVVRKPKAGTPTPLTFCETDDFSAYTNLDLFAQLANEDSGGNWSDISPTNTGELTGAGDSFINLQNIAANFGPGTYTFSYYVSSINPICPDDSANVVIIIKPVVDLNGATLVVAPNICFSEIGITPIIGTITQGVTPIPNGTYNITYVLSGANAGTATVPVTFTGGTGQFTINSAFLSTAGTTTVSITTVLDPTPPINCTRTISNLNATFIINENPNISNSQLVINDICLGQPGQGQISDINGPVIQLSNGNYNVTFNITGPNGTVTGQTANITISGGNGVFTILSALTPIDGSYTVTITNIVNTATNCSSVANISDTFIVSPIPNAVTMTVTINDICDGQNVLVTISGANNLTNGLYTINYDVSGAINAPGQVAPNVLFTSGSGSFTLPIGILNIGVSTLTITNLFNSVSTCQTTTFSNPSDTFEIHAIPDANEINITVNDVCLGQSGTVNILDSNIGVAPELTNGVYTITYDLSGANTATGISTTASITNGVGSFSIPASQLTNVGPTTITIVIITNNTTGCDAIGVPITTNFNVLPKPIIDNVSLSVSQPICQGQSGTASITGAALINDGNYALTYNITGANTVTGQVVAVVFTSGNTTFNLPSSQIPNVGNYTITITNIVNNNTPSACSSPVTAVTTSFVVSANPNTTNTILTALDPVCLGSNGQITLTDLTGTLSDGIYNLVYNLSGANTSNNITASVTISSGSGSFSIPASLLTNLGNTVILITSIANSATNCSSPANLTVSFNIIPVPDTTGASLTVVEPICLGSSAVVQVNGPALTNGTYTLSYNLSGANSSTGNTATVVITASNGTFTIPSSLLTSSGNTIINLTLLSNTTTGCSVQGLSISDNFMVSPLPMINASEVSIADICLGNNAVVAINSLGGLIDGNYQLNYTISGANGPSAQTVLFTVVGGVVSFNILNTLLTNSGSTIISFISIINLDTTCSNSLNFNVPFMVNPLPDITPNQFDIADICLGQSATGTITNAINLVNSNYTIIYNLTGTNIANNQSATVTITTGAGTFTIPSALLVNTGATTLTIVSITNNVTGCTSSPIVIQDTFNINPLPDTTGTTIVVTEPICLGSGAVVTINSPLLADGSYNINYNLTGANNISGSSSVVLTSGNGSFVVQSSELINAGNYTISITAIINPTTLCPGTSAVITDDFVVNPVPVITSPEITINDICIGNNATVSIASSGGLVDGNYDLTYTLFGANGPSTQTVSITITGGIGNFAIPAALLPNTGLTSITIDTIVNTGTTCSNTFSIQKDFFVNPLPNINPGEIAVTDTCLGQDANGTITNALNLTNGNYAITYDLNGANIASAQTASTIINNATGGFIIPGTILTNPGSTTITITAITNITTGCTTSGLSVNYSFNVIPLPNLTGANINTADICINSTAEVFITNAAALTNGNYTIVYDLSGANNSTNNSVSIPFNSGASSFIIPTTLLTNGGSTTITIQNFIYDVTLCGANTLTLSPITFIITDPQTPTLIAEGNLFCIQDSPTIGNLSAHVNESGTITWYNAATGGIAYNATDLLVNGNTYYATITDGNSCESSIRLQVTVDLTACDDLFIPDGFSPNGDGTNDEFYIKDIELLFPNFELEIYNRYGSMVYKGNINTPRFNGKSNQTTLIGKDIVPTGVYFYILYFNDANGTKPKQGRLYLSR